MLRLDKDAFRKWKESHPDVVDIAQNDGTIQHCNEQLRVLRRRILACKYAEKTRDRQNARIAEADNLVGVLKANIEELTAELRATRELVSNLNRDVEIMASELDYLRRQNSRLGITLC